MSRQTVKSRTAKGRTAHPKTRVIQPVAASGRQLAAALGVGESTVREYLAKPDFPATRNGPWSAADVAKITVWRQTLQEDRAEEGEASQKINAGYKLERMLLTRAQRKKIEGAFVERRLLDGALQGLTKMFVAALEELERGLPLQLAGLDPGQCERVVRDRIRAVREALASRSVIELDTVDQAVRAQAQPKARGRPGVGK